MKIVLFYFLIFLSAFGLHAQTQNKIDAKDSLPTITLKEVQLIGIKATNDTPITFTNVSKKEISLRNLGQDIPILLITKSPVETQRFRFWHFPRSFYFLPFL